MERSLILGELYVEVVTLPETVMDLARQHGHRRIVVILDEHLDFPEGSTTGTALCRALRGPLHNFDGLVFMCSANDGLDDEQLYFEAGADGVFGKGLRGGVDAMVDTIARAYHTVHR